VPEVATAAAIYHDSALWLNEETGVSRDVFIIAFDPEPLSTPRDWRKLPAVWRDQRQKIFDADFQRIDANTPAQRALAGGNKIV